MRKTCPLLCLMLALLLLLPSFAMAEGTEASDKTDLLVVLTHVGDESLFFSGLLAEYAAEQGYAVRVLYAADAEDPLRAEATDHLAQLGVTAPPVFLAFPNVYSETLQDAERLWSHEELTTAILHELQSIRPAIVVTHDVMGEYGNGQHRMVSDCVLAAIERDDTQSVQRLYRHLSANESAHTVTIDAQKPLNAFFGKTALEIDTALYLAYPETMRLGRMPADTGHMQPLYTLVHAAANAPDPTDNDLFSGFDAAMLYGPHPATPTPAPTAAPIEQAETETAAVESAAAEIPAAERTVKAAPAPAMILGLSVLLLGIGAIAFAFIKKSASKQLFDIGIGSGAALLLLALVLLVPAMIKNAGTAAETEVPQAVEAPRVTPAPTAAPTAEPTEAPTPVETPHPMDSYFRQANDPAEVIVYDDAAEHWEYRTDTLSIIIDRIHTENGHGQPIAYCVAHIRMRGEDAFISGMVDRKREYLWQMARRQRAVFGITGDNLDRAEGDLKGIILRDGVVHNNRGGADTAAFMPDFSLRIYSPGEITPEQLLEMGVRNTASFGPTLVRNDLVAFESFRKNLGAINPRCGIGMVEPGHLVAITVDGRQEDYSRGISLDAFKQMFYMLGCTEAYNLDGGSSTAMVFMGEHLNKHSGMGSDVPRKLMDGLLWGSSELVPTTSDPIYSNGVVIRPVPAA